MLMNRTAHSAISPALSEIIDDPIVRAVMRSDGVSRREVERVMAGASAQMRAAARLNS